LSAKVRRDVEGKLIGSRLEFAVDQRLDAAIVIGLCCGQKHEDAVLPTRERDRDTLGGLPLLGIEHVRRDRWMARRGHYATLFVSRAGDPVSEAFAPGL